MTGGAVTGLAGVEITDSQMSQNVAEGTDFVSGGAIGAGKAFVDGSVTVTRSVLTDNDAIAGGEARGGAVKGDEVTLTDAVVERNDATGDAAAGGAVHTAVSATLRRTVARSNHAKATGSGQASGGGVHAAFTATVEDSTLSQNSLAASVTRRGSAVSSTTVTVSNTTVAGNTGVNALRSIDELTLDHATLHGDQSATRRLAQRVISRGRRPVGP